MGIVLLNLMDLLWFKFDMGISKMLVYCFCMIMYGWNMVGVCGFWCVIGMKDGDFGKFIIVVVNLFM